MTYPRRPPERVLVSLKAVLLHATFPDVEGPSRLERHLKSLGSIQLSSFWKGIDELGHQFNKFGYYVFLVDPEQLRAFREACRLLMETGVELEEFSVQ